jgi:hypothetical protein
MQGSSLISVDSDTALSALSTSDMILSKVTQKHLSTLALKEAGQVHVDS